MSAAGMTDPAGMASAAPALATAAGWSRLEEFTRAGFVTMVRALPWVLAASARRSWRASRRDAAAAVGLNIMAGAANTFGLLATQGVGAALLAGGATVGRLWAAAPSLIAVAAALIVRAGLSIAAKWAQARLKPQVEQLVEREFHEAATAVELSAFDDPPFVDGMNRAQTRGLECAAWLVDGSIDLLTSLIGLVAASVALAVVQPLLVPAIAIVALPAGWAAVRTARQRYASAYARTERRRRVSLLSGLMATRAHAAELRSQGVRDFLLDEYRRVVSLETGAEVALSRREAATKAVSGLLAGFAAIGVYALLVLMAANGWLALAAAGTAVLAIQMAQQAIRAMVTAVGEVYDDGLYARDYAVFVADAAARTPDGGGEPAPESFGVITLDQVGLRYPGADRPALREVSLRLAAGEVVAIVGENGSGKSTLAKVLAGLYRPSSGAIWWDERPVARMSAESVRSRVAVIAQDYARWPLTVRENIAAGWSRRPGIDTAVRAAARAAGADEVVARLPYGYDTLLDRTFRDGHELSGGQWQRLAAARAFLRDAPLLICDEPSAALDARAEHELFRRLLDFAAGRTVVLITHRLANVRMADRIVLLHEGQVREEGGHDELMAAGGRYAELFSLQASGYLAPSA